MSNTATSSTALKAFFETGDVPTESQFSDFISSSPNIVDDNLLVGSDVDITAHAGGGQASAYQITKKANQVTTVGTIGDSLKLPAALAGRTGFIFCTTTLPANLYPASGESFVNGGPDAPIPLYGGYTLFFYCLFDTQWCFYYLSDTGQAQNIPVITTSASTLNIFPSLGNTYQYTALAANLTVAAPTFNFQTGQVITIIIKDNGTSRTLTWNAIFRGVAYALPAATVVSSTMYFTFIYNTTDAKWDLMSYSVQGLQRVMKRVYRAILNQSGTSAPTATVLENTLGGTPTFSRGGAGDYQMTLSLAFASAKTHVIINNSAIDIASTTQAICNPPNQIGIETYDDSQTFADDILNDTAIQVFTYF